MTSSTQTKAQHAAIAQSRDLQRAKAIQDRQDMLKLVRSKGYRSPDEFNAAKMAELMARGKKI
jgi:hypothetical protein